jgi:hypothetical protein
MTTSRCRNIYGSATPINLSRKILSPTLLLTFSLTEPADSPGLAAAVPISSDSSDTAERTERRPPEFCLSRVLKKKEIKCYNKKKPISQYGDPDPHVFGPPGSGSISQRYGYGSSSGSFFFLINVLSGLK